MTTAAKGVRVTKGLVLSAFPGIDVLGMGFEDEGWCKEACQLQGLPEGYDIPAFTVRYKQEVVGNAVPYVMARAIAKAVRQAAPTTPSGTPVP